jgi:hypothetical protein
VDNLDVGNGAIGEFMGSGVMLDTRVKHGTPLHYACTRLADHHIHGLNHKGLSSDGQCASTTAPPVVVPLCPKNTWQMGRVGVKDNQWYLISAWNYGHTQTHLDHGCQTVLYHMLTGDNVFIGCPRKLGAVIWAFHKVHESPTHSVLFSTDLCSPTHSVLFSTDLCTAPVVAAGPRRTVPLSCPRARDVGS